LIIEEARMLYVGDDWAEAIMIETEDDSGKLLARRARRQQRRVMKESVVSAAVNPSLALAIPPRLDRGLCPAHHRTRRNPAPESPQNLTYPIVGCLAIPPT